MGQAKRRKLAGQYPSKTALDERTIAHGRGTKQYGDIFTPPAIAKKMAEYMRPKLREFAAQGKTMRVLDPAAGTGNLIWPLIEVAREEGCKLEIVVVEIQEDYCIEIAKKARQMGIEVEFAAPALKQAA